MASWSEKDSGSFATPVLENGQQQHRGTYFHRNTRKCILALVALIGIISQIRSLGLPSSSHSHCGTNADASPGSPFGLADTTLNWVPCGDRFQCSNLSVPLDWTNLEDPRRASIAITRYLAADRSTVNGTIIFNPGGPGGSGTGSTFRIGPLLDKIFEGKYDVLGFDPRGINMTSPRVHCLLSDEARLQLELVMTSSAPSRNLHDIGIWDAASQLIAEECEGNSGADILPFVNTPTVARDIAAIVDALHDEHKHHVSYWGFSYGTNLGAIFTAMFPNKLHKIILDGIRSPLDADELYKWGYTSVASQDDVFEGYFSICEKVGKARCPLAGLEKSPRQTVMDLLDALYERPLPVSTGSRDGLTSLTGLVTFSKYKAYLYGTLYRGSNWHKFADITLDLLNGNGSSFLQATNPGQGIAGSEWGTAVLCTDAVPATNYPLSNWAEFVSNMSALSFIAGDFRALSNLPCRHWYSLPNERWQGSFDDLELDTPILMIGNTNDPATPLESAIRLSKVMSSKNAVLLTQDSYGHCSTSAVSTCTYQILIDYLLEGKLPDSGTVCEVDDKEYGDYFPHETKALSYSPIRELAGKLMDEVRI